MLRCLTLTAESDNEKLQRIRDNLPWIDAVEVRLDFCSTPNTEFITSVLEEAPAKVILTYRKVEDGGVRQVPEQKRLKVLEDLLLPGIGFIDLEYGLSAPALEDKAGKLGVKIIRSVHDFSGVPDRMVEIIEESAAAGEIPKIACYPRTSADVSKLLSAVERTSSVAEKIILGMGEFGFFTRVAPLLCGSMLTFCSDGMREGAPGQISARTMEEVYRVSHHNKATVYYGIIGNPVLHTKSPQIHNRWFAEKGMNAAYIPFQVDDVSLFMEAAGRLGIRGFSVTVPHKQKIIGELDQVEDAVKKIGSCNTVVRFKNGWYGNNTDYEGFLKPLRSQGILKEGVAALVVGAGGVARTVVYALKTAGLQVTIVNRTDEKAEMLAEETGALFHPINTELPADYFQLVVQTTSAGMEPYIEVDPLPGYQFSGSEVVYELIYAPEETRFLQRAARKGCRTIGGKVMLHEQAVLQFDLFSSAYNP